MASTTTTYIHDKKQSFQAGAIQRTFSLFGMKKGGMIIKAINQPTSTEAPVPVPKRMLRKFDVQESVIQKRKVWTVKPKGNDKREKAVIYLHGGVYLFNINTFHWKLVETLMDQTNATFVVPDYPLAPEFSCEEAIDFVGQVYGKVLNEYSPSNIIVAGDSSGGGLALGFAMDLKKTNKPQPSQLLLLSPWLDVTMRNPDIVSIDKNDKIMGIAPLQTAGKVYAGGIDVKDSRASPVYGDLSGLGRISVFIGSHDLFVADCRKLKQRAKDEGISMRYFEYPKMFHGWFFIGGMKESKAAINQMCALMNESE